MYVYAQPHGRHNNYYDMKRNRVFSRTQYKLYAAAIQKNCYDFTSPSSVVHRFVRTLNIFEKSSLKDIIITQSSLYPNEFRPRTYDAIFCVYTAHYYYYSVRSGRSVRLHFSFHYPSYRAYSCCCCCCTYQ